MKNLIKTTTIIASLFLGSITGGCALIHPNPSDSPEVSLVKAEGQTKTVSGLTVIAYLGTINDLTDRAKVGSFLYQSADAVQTAAASENLTTEQLRAYANGLIQKSNIKEKERVGFVLNSISLLIEDQLDAEFGKISSNAKIETGRRLIEAAATGIKEVTSSYRANVEPTTAPIPKSLDSVR